MLKSKRSDLILGVSEMLNFSFLDYLKFMPSPQLFDLIHLFSYINVTNYCASCLTSSPENVHASCARFIKIQPCARACARHFVMVREFE